jgi:hypothetical protein
MQVRNALEVINGMVADGVILDYAIGGAIAAIYYVEPFFTADLDIFVHLKPTWNSLMPLSEIYEYLQQRGHKPSHEFLLIGDVPVQFLPVFDDLSNEAVEMSQAIDFEGIPTRIIKPEHLVSMMLKVGRPKDYLRIAMFLECKAVNKRALNAVLKRHGLWEKWTANEKRFTS